MAGNRSKSKSRSPKQARSKATVDAILTAAARVFGSQGAGGTTSEVARAAGVSVGSLYEYFDSKDALIAAVRDRFDADLDAFLHRVAEAPEAEFEEELDRWFGAMVDFHRAEPGLHDLGDNAPSQANRLADYRAQAVDFLSRHPEAVRPTDLETAARIVVGVIEALVHQVSADSPALLADKVYVDEVRQLILRYLKRASSD